MSQSFNLGKSRTFDSWHPDDAFYDNRTIQPLNVKFIKFSLSEISLKMQTKALIQVWYTINPFNWSDSQKYFFFFFWGGGGDGIDEDCDEGEAAVGVDVVGLCLFFFSLLESFKSKIAIIFFNALLREKNVFFISLRLDYLFKVHLADV